MEVRSGNNIYFPIIFIAPKQQVDIEILSCRGMHFLDNVPPNAGSRCLLCLSCFSMSSLFDVTGLLPNCGIIAIYIYIFSFCEGNLSMFI